jgi:membrane protease YdiL (CAAX protease family)
LTAVAGFFMAAMVGSLVANILEAMNIEVAAQEVVNTFQNAEHPSQKLLLALMAIIFAPFVEELMFRGVLFTALKQHLPRWIAIWGSALFFGLVHANVMSFIPLTLLAVLLTRLYEHTSNLWAPIFAHAIFNSINLGLMLWLPELIETQTP